MLLEQVVINEGHNLMTVKRRKDSGAWDDARTKNGRPRVIPLHPRALAIAKQLPFKGITPAVLRKQFEKARKTCGMEHIHWHDLRHTFASWLIQKGTPLQVVKELMGHANIQMTMRYAHLETDNLKAAVHSL